MRELPWAGKAVQSRAMSTSFKSVIFDLGGVVVEWNPQAVVARFTVDRELRAALFANVFGHADWAELDRGGIDETTAIARMQVRLPRPEGEYLRLMRAADDSLRPQPDTLALIERLDAAGVPLFVLSNMPVDRFALLRGRHDFWGRFRDFVISGEVGLLKPQAEIFRHALARFGLAADETVFIDDHAANVAAARALGMHGLLFRDARTCAEQLARLRCDLREPGST